MFSKIKTTLSIFFTFLAHWIRSALRLPHKDNIKILVFSLLLSIALWCFVSYDNQARAVRTISVPVQYIGLARGLDKKGDTEAVQIKIQGNEKSLLKLSTENVNAKVNLKGKSAGTYTLNIDVATSYADVKVVEVSPEQAEVSIFQVDKKIVPIKVNLIGQAEKQNISEIVLTPSQIAISGKKDVIKAINDLSVDLDTQKLDSSGNATLPISNLPKQFLEGADYTLSQGNVAVHVVFGNEIITKELPLTYTLVGKPKAGIEISRQVLFPSSVKVKATASFFDKVKRINIGKIDISGIEATTVLEVPFAVSDDFKRLHPDVEFYAPSKLRLDIVCREQLVKRLYKNIPIGIVGQDATKIKLSSPVASVAIVTTESILNSFKDEIPFEIFVDATDVVQKRITLPISFKAKQNGVKLITIAPSAVTIEQ